MIRKEDFAVIQTLHPRGVFQEECGNRAKMKHRYARQRENV